MNRDSKLMKSLIMCATVLVGLYFIFKVVNIISEEYDTVSAETSTAYETVNSKAYFIRDEKLLINKNGGTVVSVAKNAEKVNTGSNVALTFADTDSAESYVQKEYLEELLEGYRVIDNQTAFTNVDVALLNQEVAADFESITEAVYKGDFSSLGDLKLDFLVDTSRLQISYSEDIDCSEKIASLESEIASLSSGKQGLPISSGTAGYYVSGADGYESVIPFAALDEINADDVEKALKSTPKAVPENCIGKVVNGFYWFLAAPVDTDEAKKLNEGSTVNIIVGNSGSKKIKADIYSIRKQDDKKSLVILRGNSISSDLLMSRTANLKIIVNEYTGLKVPKKAVRMTEGKSGCFVRVGNVTKFRALNIIYSNDEFVIAVDNGKIEYPDTHLKKHDEIILNGRGLSVDV